MRTFDSHLDGQIFYAGDGDTLDFEVDELVNEEA